MDLQTKDPTQIQPMILER